MKKNWFQNDMSRRAFWAAVALLVLAKLALSRFQMIWVWVDGAPIDDELMFRAAQSISAGQWLGPYDWLTLSKHMFFAVWLALCNALHLPYLAAGQLLASAAALAAALAFAPVLRRYKSRLAVFGLLAFNPALSAAFTLRVYRDNIFPALCLLFFAGLCGAALRWGGPVRRTLPWLGLAGLGLAAAWLCREDGMWLLPFALAGSLILALAALRTKCGGLQKALRCAALLAPFGILAAGILAFSAVNYAWYGVFTVSDFSSGGFAAAMGAMNRVGAASFEPLVSVPAAARTKLYQKVPALAPLEKWLEQDEDLQNSYRNPELEDYQSGSFYWAVRRAAFYEGVYDTAPGAQRYWQQVADEINALCDAGELPSAGGRRVGTTPPIRAQYVAPVLAEGFKSLGYALTFGGCEPYDAQNRSIGLPEDLAVWEQYLGERANSAAQAGTALPYYSPLQKAAYFGLEAVRLAYAAGLPVLFAAALVLQARQGLRLLAARRQKALMPGPALLWALLAGLLGMALLRCFMIAFMEVASFNIGTYAMYLATVHPLLILFSAAGVLTVWKENAPWRI